MKFKYILLVVILMGLTGVVGYQFGNKQWKADFATMRVSMTQGRDVDFAQFWQVWDRVHALYVDQAALDPQKLIQGATAGMVSSLGDPYTVYLTPEQNKDAKADLGGSFEGVGIQLGFVDKQLAVVAPLEGTPAKIAGVRAGDLITHIKDERNKVDQDTVGLTLPQAVALIRGPGGTHVELTLVREGVLEPIVVDLVRQTIQVKSAEVEFVGEFAWLKLNRFGDKTKQEWDEAVNQIVARDSRGIILDVRNNPGGYLDGSIYIASEFLAKGKVVVIQQSGDNNKEEAKVVRDGKLLDIPVVVLVNEGSASAAEILAGALQDHARAIIVGVKSFGKGSVQQPEDFSDGAGVHVTIAKWLTPKGVWIDKNGIVPEIEVKIDPTLEIKTPEDDPQLQKAIEFL